MTVLVNGCFDLLHEGHKYMLRAAAGYGDLTIGLNTDESIKALKGEGRPVQTYEQRAEAILDYFATLGTAVDVIPFHGDAVTLARQVNPDVIIRGHDQASERGLPCAIVRLGKWGDFSTTKELETHANWKRNLS